MRRTLLFALVTALVALGAVPAIAGDKGELTSSFHNELNQMRSPDFDGFDRPDGYIGDSDDGTELICDDLAVGAWFTWTGSDKDVLEMVTVEVRLDGEVLDLTRTPDRRVTFRGEKVWGFTLGVPVIGVLDPGLHVLEYEVPVGSIPDLFPDGIVIPIEIDVSSAHC